MFYRYVVYCFLCVLLAYPPGRLWTENCFFLFHYAEKNRCVCLCVCVGESECVDGFLCEAIIMFTWNMSLWHCICLLNIQCELCSNYKTEASAIINRQLKSELLQLQLPDWHHSAPHQLGNYRQQLERNTGQPKSVRMCRWMCVSLHMCVCLMLVNWPLSSAEKAREKRS